MLGIGEGQENENPTNPPQGKRSMGSDFLIQSMNRKENEADVKKV